MVWLTLLSLDAPAVAALWQRLFARSFGVPLSAAVTAELAIAVWLLYVLDRILDSLRVPPAAREPVRHRFYRVHRRFFLPPFIAALGAAGWLALERLDKDTLETGLVLMMAVGVYFFSVHIRPPAGGSRVAKELVVAALFAAGTSFPVWRGIHSGRGAMLPPLLIFSALAWLNCAAIEYSEWRHFGAAPAGEGGAEGDAAAAAAPHPTTVWLGANLKAASLAVGIAAASLGAPGLARPVWRLYAAEAAAAAAFALIEIKSKKMRRDLFRVLMDVALLTPAVFLPFWGA